MLRSLHPCDLATSTYDSSVKLTSVRAATGRILNQSSCYTRRRQFDSLFETSFITHSWQLFTRELVKFVNVMGLASLTLLLYQNPFLLHFVRLQRADLHYCRLRWLPFEQRCSITKLGRHL